MFLLTLFEICKLHSLKKVQLALHFKKLSNVFASKQCLDLQVQFISVALFQSQHCLKYKCKLHSLKKVQLLPTNRFAQLGREYNAIQYTSTGVYYNSCLYILNTIQLFVQLNFFSCSPNAARITGAFELLRLIIEFILYSVLRPNKF